MERELKIKDALKISEIIYIFDQSIFAKAAEIKWKSPEKFKDCILVLGTFHMIMLSMLILAKQFGDAGLRDTLFQAGVIADGSADSAFQGKCTTEESILLN